MRKNVLVIVTLGLLCSLALPISTFAQVATTTAATTTSTIAATSTSTTIIATTTPVVISFPNAAEVKIQVQTYFADIPVMINIARCESGFRQFADSGNVFMGGDGTMVGIFQVSENVHRTFALSIGMDLNTVTGNMQYARYLYQHYGTSPWIASMPCWNTNPVPEGGLITIPTPVSTTTPSFPTPQNSTQTSAQVTPTNSSSISNSNLSINLIFGMVNPQVQTLQQLLNKAGFTIAATGPGSPGNETTSFGNLTRVAVRSFQCAQKLVCSGDEYTTAYGLVGPNTRQALLSAASVGSSNTISVSTVIPTNSVTADQTRIANIKNQILQLQQQIANLQAQLPQ